MKITLRTNGETTNPELDCSIFDDDGNQMDIVEALTIRISVNDDSSLVLDGVELEVIGSRYDIKLDSVKAAIPELAHARELLRSSRPLMMSGPTRDAVDSYLARRHHD